MLFNLYFKRIKELSINKDIIIKSIISVRVPSGEATAKAPLGPTLGQYGIMIGEFCTRFNELTAELESGILINTKIILYADMTYDIYLDSIDTLYYIRKIINMPKFGPFGKRVFIGGKKEVNNIITTSVLYEIVKFNYSIFKYKHITLRSFYKCICNTIRSLGIILISTKKYNFLN
jgi:large subunit ribosomal protein L11